MGCFEKCFDTIQYPSFQSRACFLDVPSLLRFFLLSFLIDFWWWESFDPDNRIVIYVWSLYIGLSFWYPCPQTTNVKKTQNTPPQIISRQFASHIAEKKYIFHRREERVCENLPGFPADESKAFLIVPGLNGSALRHASPASSRAARRAKSRALPRYIHVR